MKEFFLPLLLGVFTLFFSGKQIDKTNCGPTLTINKIGTEPMFSAVLTQWNFMGTIW